jgi:hypothetical protein
MSGEQDAVTGVEEESAAGKPSGLPVDRWVADLFEVGQVWARHGLSVGSSALEAGAQTLHSTADLLHDLSRRFSHESSESYR